MELFSNLPKKIDSVPQDVDITNTMLIYSTAELKEFKQLCKAGIKEEYGENYQNGNFSDLILNLLREKYGKKANS